MVHEQKKIALMFAEKSNDRSAYVPEIADVVEVTGNRFEHIFNFPVQLFVHCLFYFCPVSEMAVQRGFGNADAF